MTKLYYYLTQYDSCGMYNSDVIQLLVEGLEGLKKEDVKELLSLAPEVEDRYNQILYNKIINGGVNAENVSVLIEVWEALSVGDLEAVYNILEFDYYDYLITSDNVFYSFEELEEWADEDLKNNGVNANCLYWLNELHSGRYHVFNGYANGFYYYDSVSEVLGDFVEISEFETLINEL